MFIIIINVSYHYFVNLYYLFYYYILVNSLRLYKLIKINLTVIIVLLYMKIGIKFHKIKIIIIIYFFTKNCSSISFLLYILVQGFR